MVRLAEGQGATITGPSQVKPEDVGSENLIFGFTQAANSSSVSHQTNPHLASDAFTSSTHAVTPTHHRKQIDQHPFSPANHSLTAFCANVILSPKLSAIPCVLLLILTCP